jgi:hypothetical protein
LGASCPHPAKAKPAAEAPEKVKNLLEIFGCSFDFDICFYFQYINIL